MTDRLLEQRFQTIKYAVPKIINFTHSRQGITPTFPLSQFAQITRYFVYFLMQASDVGECRIRPISALSLCVHPTT